MDWLILVENQDKANAIRKNLTSNSSSATVISTKGSPWDLEIELSSKKLEYKVRVKEKFKELVTKIQRNAESADLVLLAFDPTNIGEASAREFEKMIGKQKCIRWVPKDLSKKTLKKLLEKFETHESYRPHCSQAIADCHWSQAVTDIVWTNKVSEYLSSELETSVKMTRLMLAIVKSISDQERRAAYIKEKNIRHWEVEIVLKRPSGDYEELETKVIVPTLSQIDSSAGKITREIWKKKLRESKEASMSGFEIGQPQPGKAWRFSSYQEAASLKNHIKKFPYFIVESIQKTQVVEPTLCPLNYYLVLELTYKNKGATRKEVDESLNWLYFNGLITYPKTASINLSHQTISELFAYGKNMGWQIEKTPHEFSGSDDENERSEALHPVSWDISPEDLQYTENWRSNKHKELSYWIYNQIYQRAKESQSPQKNGEEKRHFLSGPLFLTRKEAIEKQGKKFSITKENELQAHMNVLLGSRDPWENIPENYVLESNEVYIKERKVSLPENINIPLLIERLASENIGRIETLEHLANLLLEQAIIETSPTTKLSRKGNAIVDELERSMGEYMDLNYYKCLTDMFKKIELGQKNPEEFLNEWWYNFRTILESSRQARGDQNTKKPVSTKNHDSNSRREDDYNKNTIPDQQQKRVKYG